MRRTDPRVAYEEGEEEEEWEAAGAACLLEGPKVAEEAAPIEDAL